MAQLIHTFVSGCSHRVRYDLEGQYGAFAACENLRPISFGTRTYSGPQIKDQRAGMNLKEFVEETLSEILDGVRAAQKKEGGSTVGALTSAAFKHVNLVELGGIGYLAIIEFDVSVAAETAAGGKGGLRVMSIGVEGGGEHKSSETSRVKFSVPVVLPQGDDQRVKGFDRQL